MVVRQGMFPKVEGASAPSNKERIYWRQPTLNQPPEHLHLPCNTYCRSIWTLGFLACRKP